MRRLRRARAALRQFEEWRWFVPATATTGTVLLVATPSGRAALAVQAVGLTVIVWMLTWSNVLADRQLAARQRVLDTEREHFIAELARTERGRS